MPRPKKVGRSRDYDPTPTEEWWLVGKPLPIEPPGIVRQALGYPAPRIGDDECTLQGLNPFEALELRRMGRTRQGPARLERLRTLYEAAPVPIRRRVPELRRKILEAGPDADLSDLLAEDERQMDELRRETTWQSDVLNEWYGMSEKEQRDVISRAVRERSHTPADADE